MSSRPRKCHLCPTKHANDGGEGGQNMGKRPTEQAKLWRDRSIRVERAMHFSRKFALPSGIFFSLSGKEEHGMTKETQGRKLFRFEIQRMNGIRFSKKIPFQWNALQEDFKVNPGHNFAAKVPRKKSRFGIRETRGPTAGGTGINKTEWLSGFVP